MKADNSQRAESCLQQQMIERSIVVDARDVIIQTWTLILK